MYCGCCGHFDEEEGCTCPNGKNQWWHVTPSTPACDEWIDANDMNEEK